MRPDRDSSRQEPAAAKLLQALEMYDDGVAMVRLRLERALGVEGAQMQLSAWLLGAPAEKWPAVHVVALAADAELPSAPHTAQT